MMSATVDANVLLYASNTDAPEHARAKGVVDRLLAGPALTTLLWPVLLSYLRTVTHPLDLRAAAGPGCRLRCHW